MHPRTTGTLLPLPLPLPLSLPRSAPLRTAAPTKPSTAPAPSLTAAALAEVEDLAQSLFEAANAMVAAEAARRADAESTARDLASQLALLWRRPRRRSPTLTMADIDPSRLVAFLDYVTIAPTCANPEQLPFAHDAISVDVVPCLAFPPRAAVQGETLVDAMWAGSVGVDWAVCDAGIDPAEHDAPPPRRSSANADAVDANDHWFTPPPSPTLAASSTVAVPLPAAPPPRPCAQCASSRAVATVRFADQRGNVPVCRFCADRIDACGALVAELRRLAAGGDAVQRNMLDAWHDVVDLRARIVYARLGSGGMWWVRRAQGEGEEEDDDDDGTEVGARDADVEMDERSDEEEEDEEEERRGRTRHRRGEQPWVDTVESALSNVSMA
ncbi:hypothetical protein GGF31_001605 [Allomyces arbusculus]|nr:hypothetical protein GGF31_001605 [Allomyces arbusculus]